MPGTDSTQHLLRMATAFQHARLLLAAMEQGLFAELARGPRTIERLRAALPGLGEGLPEFLEALVATGLLGREGADRGAVYANTRDSARLVSTALPSADVMVLGSGPGPHQAATLQQLIAALSGMSSIAGVLVVMDCTAPLRTLEQSCRDAGFPRTQILPLVAPVCAVFAHR